MNSLQKTKDQIKFDEGLSLKPYFCPAGKLTIGTGRNLEDNGITEKEADYLLNNDIQKVIEELIVADEASRVHNINNGFAYESFFINQPEEIQSVLINMAFNLGISGLLKFVKTLDFIGARRYSKASEEMLDSRWAKQVGVRAERLSKVVNECNPDAPSGDLHKALDVTVPSGYKVKIFTTMQEFGLSSPRKDNKINDWLEKAGNIYVSKMTQANNELTILYRMKE